MELLHQVPLWVQMWVLLDNKSKTHHQLVRTLHMCPERVDLPPRSHLDLGGFVQPVLQEHDLVLHQCLLFLKAAELLCAACTHAPSSLPVGLTPSHTKS